MWRTDNKKTRTVIQSPDLISPSNCLLAYEILNRPNIRLIRAFSLVISKQYSFSDWLINANKTSSLGQGCTNYIEQVWRIQSNFVRRSLIWLMVSQWQKSVIGSSSVSLNSSSIFPFKMTHRAPKWVTLLSSENKSQYFPFWKREKCHF